MKELPPGVELVAAAKGRSPAEVNEAVAAGIRIIGENYVQEAERLQFAVNDRVQRHFIGHLQQNKVKKAVRLLDMIQTVDSIDLAREISRQSGSIGKNMPVLVEINSGREPQKHGVLPENAIDLVKEIASLSSIRVMGLMTMGPVLHEAEEIRPFFAETRRLFDTLKGLNFNNVEMKYLSMGMTNSYKVAIEEGANIVRLGTRLFGERGSGKATG